MENGTLAEVEEDLRSVCGNEGIILVVAKSSRVDDGSSSRVDFTKFFCQKAGKGRRDQEQYLLCLDNGKRMPGAGAVFAGHVYILKYSFVWGEYSETSRIKRDARGVRQVDTRNQYCQCCLCTHWSLASILCCLLCAVPGITRRNGCGTSRIGCPFEVRAWVCVGACVAYVGAGGTCEYVRRTSQN